MAQIIIKVERKKKRENALVAQFVCAFIDASCFRCSKKRVDSEELWREPQIVTSDVQGEVRMGYIINSNSNPSSIKNIYFGIALT